MAKYIICIVFILITFVEKSCSFNLTLMHTNDFQSRFEEFNEYLTECSEQDSTGGKCFGGVSRLVTATKDIRDSRDNVIFLNAGDSFQGTIWYTYYKGAATAHFTNKLGIDAAVSTYRRGV